MSVPTFTTHSFAPPSLPSWRLAEYAVMRSVCVCVCTCVWTCVRVWVFQVQERRGQIALTQWPATDVYTCVRMHSRTTWLGSSISFSNSLRHGPGRGKPHRQILPKHRHQGLLQQQQRHPPTTCASMESKKKPKKTMRMRMVRKKQNSSRENQLQPTATTNKTTTTTAAATTLMTMTNVTWQSHSLQTMTCASTSCSTLCTESSKHTSSFFFLSTSPFNPLLAFVLCCVD